MIDPTQRSSLIKLRLDQAADAIGVAELLVQNNAWPTALNRVYYGMFYAVMALALRDNFQTSKHGQLIGWFNKNYVAAGIFDPILSRMLQESFHRRNDADYEIKPLPDIEEIRRVLADMKLFIATIKAWIEANPA
ncbi:MAG: HEPN domain-containing protein [Saprospiraceae bacterium]